MAKLKRSALAHYVDASMGGVTDWHRLGKDLGEYSVDLGVDVETKKNILDETSVTDNGFEPSAAIETYYADPEDPMYDHLVNIAMNRLTGGACETKYLEVIIEDTEDSTHKAWIEDVIIKPTSYGGDTSGVQIPFSINFNGNRKEGTVTITGGKPTFTPNE